MSNHFSATRLFTNESFISRSVFCRNINLNPLGKGDPEYMNLHDSTPLLCVSGSDDRLKLPLNFQHGSVNVLSVRQHGTVGLFYTCRGG